MRDHSYDDRLSIQPILTADGLVVALSLSGELDAATGTALCDLTVTVMSHGTRHLDMDLAAVTRCDNASLYTILGIRHALAQAGGSLVITAMSPAVCAALAHTGLAQLLPLDAAQAPGLAWRFIPEQQSRKE